jgi:arylformamidase
MYDLQPVRRSSRSRYVMFTDAVEEAISPQRHIEAIDIPLILMHGTAQTPEFQRQSRDFAAALAKAGKPGQAIVAAHYNHLEVMEMSGNPCSPLGRAALAQVR